MLALRCSAGQLILDPGAPLPPNSGEALVRITLAGICNTDLEILRGYMDFAGVLGHEFVGIVEYSPSGQLNGRRVVGEINANCAVCATCRAGHPTHCPHRTTLGIAGRDGAHAEYLRLPERNLHIVPDSVPDEAAVFTEPLAAALEIFDRIAIRPTDRVALLGDGKLGLLVAQVLALTGCDLLLLGHHREKLQLAAGRGIATRLLASSGDAPPPASFDVVVECTGHPGGFASARRLVRPRGTLVLKSTFHADLTLNMSQIVVDEITLIGSRCGPFSPALRLLAAGRVDVQPLIDSCFPLKQGVEAYARAAERGTLKVLLRP
ncbi:MAG: alcohol dehydrogenase catalytic domain-containing protein [Chloroflexi bacterium]|nr:alcohol dehydrogenase catalytic domain-containing protein [Chloroflexota bacterium]